ETGDSSLCERERIVVDRKIANSDVARIGNLQCRCPGRIDQLRSVSMDLDAAELFEDDGTLDSVNGVFIEVEDDMSRPSGLVCLGGRFGNHGDGFCESGVMIGASRGEIRHVKDGGWSVGLR